MKLIKSFKVTPADTARQIGSGTLRVLATPKVAAWFEGIATELAANAIANTEETSVGTNINLDHLKKSLVGETITCEVTLTAREGNKMTFTAEAFNEKRELIARATHTRFVVNIERFMK